MIKLFRHEMPIGKNPGEVIFWLRRKQCLTQSYLAQTVGMTSQKLSRIERGLCEMTSSEVVKFAKYFDVPSDYILLNIEEKHYGNQF